MKWVWLIMVITILSSCNTLNNQITSNIIHTQKSYPCHRISYEQIDVQSYPMQAMINTQLIKTEVAGTNSMTPTITPNSTILYKKFNNEELCVGDMIYFNRTSANCINNLNKNNDFLLHRVIDKDIDNEGVYYRTKGDSTTIIDDCKIRNKDIKMVVVGILY